MTEDGDYSLDIDKAIKHDLREEGSSQVRAWAVAAAVAPVPRRLSTHASKPQQVLLRASLG